MLVWHAHKSKIREMAFSPDGRWLVTTAGSGRFCSVWEATTGKLHTNRIGYSRRELPRVAFAPTGELFVAVGVYISVWNVEEGAMRCWLDCGAFCDTLLAVCPVTGRLVATKLGQWLVWDEPTKIVGELGKKPTRRVPISNGMPTRLGFSATGAHLAVADGAVGLWDPAPGRRPLQYFSDPGLAARASLFAFDRDDTRLAVSFGQRVAVWVLADEESKPVVLRGHTSLVRAVGFHPLGELLTAGMDGFVRVWDPATGTELRSHDWGIGKVQAATISADGALCAAGSDGGHIVVWDTGG